MKKLISSIAAAQTPIVTHAKESGAKKKYSAFPSRETGSIVAQQSKHFFINELEKCSFLCKNIRFNTLVMTNDAAIPNG